MAKIIGTASVKVTSDTATFGTEASRGIKRSLQNSIKGDELEPGLNRLEGDLDKFGKKVSALFAGIFSGLKASAIAELVSIAPQAANALVPLLGLIGLIPGAVGIAAASVVTLTLGLHGFGKALKDAGDPKKFAADLRNLAPAAQLAARTIASLRPAFKSLQLDVQQRLFAGLAAQIRSLATAQLPVLHTGLGLIATALGNAARQFLSFFSSQSARGDLSVIFLRTAQAIQNVASALRPLLDAFFALAAQGSTALARLTSNFGDLAQRFDAFVQRVTSNGQFFDWIEQGISALFSLADIFRNVASIILTLLQGLDSSGGTFLDTLNQLTFQFAQFLKSAQGQQALHALAAILGQIGKSVGPLFLSLLQLVAQVLIALSPFIQLLVQRLGTDLVGAVHALTPLLVGLATFLGNNAGAMSNLVIAAAGLFLAFKAFGIIATAVEILKDLRTALLLATGAETLAAAATAILDGALAVLFSPITLTVAAVLALAGVVFLLIRNWSSVAAFFTGLWNGIVSLAETVWTGLAGFFTGLWSAITGALESAWNAVAGFFIGLWNSISSFLVKVWTAIVNATRPIWQPMVVIFGDILAIIKDLFIIVFGSIAIAVIAIWHAIVAAAEAIWRPLAAFFSLLWRGVEAVSRAVWGALSGFFRAVWGGIVAAARAIFGPIAAFFRALWNGISAVARAVWGPISSFLRAVWGGIVAVARTVFGPIASFFRSAWNAAFGAIRGVVGSIVGFVRGIPGAILRALGNLGNILFDAGKKILGGLLHGLESGLGAVKNFLGGIANKIVGWKGPPEFDATILIGNGQLIMDGLVNGLSSRMANLRKFLGTVTDTVVAGISGAPTSVNVGGGTPGAGPAGGGNPIILNQKNFMLPGTDPATFAAQAAQAMGRQLASGASVIATTPQNPTPGMTNNLLATGSLT